PTPIFPLSLTDALPTLAVAQKAKTTTVQTSEGIYTIVEYPTGKETVVTLNPVGLAGATGRATILRDPNGATIKLNLTSLPPDVTDRKSTRLNSSHDQIS